ncbi:MAG: TRAP transporter small permease [Betaproteobacteria bacterium]|nr:MAG: TRAP transporter small permease [Betaproteobacteria bacterium]
MLDKFARFNETIARWTTSAGFAAVVFMIVLTGADVVGTKTMRLPVPGALDMMALAQLVAITLAAGMTLVERRHVSVEFFVQLLPKRLQLLIECAVELLSLALFLLLVWRLFQLGYFQQTGNETTPTIRIPLAPFAYLAALALVPVCLVLVQRFLALLVSLAGDER